MYVCVCAETNRPTRRSNEVEPFVAQSSGLLAGGNRFQVNVCVFLRLREQHTEKRNHHRKEENSIWRRRHLQKVATDDRLCLSTLGCLYTAPQYALYIYSFIIIVAYQLDVRRAFSCLFFFMFLSLLKHARSAGRKLFIKQIVRSCFRV